MADRRSPRLSAQPSAASTTATRDPAQARGERLADLALLCATLDRFVKGDQGTVCWIANRFGEHLGISPAERARRQAHRALRTVAVLALGDSPRLGQSEARTLLRAFFRHDRRRLALLDALLAAPLVAARVALEPGGQRATAELVGGPGCERVVELDEALWLGPELVEPLADAPVTRWTAPGAGEAQVLGWLVERGLFVAVASLSQAGLERVRDAAAQRQLPPEPDAETTRRFWAGMLEAMVVAALEPQPVRHAQPGRQGLLEQPSWHVRDALRRWLVAGLERLPLEARLPSLVRPSQLAALPRQRSLRWLFADGLEPRDALDTLEPLFTQLRFALLPPAARDFAAGPRDPRLAAWMALDELLAVHGFAPDASLATCSEWAIQAAPLATLALPRELALWDDLAPTASIQAALRWADARPDHPDTARITAAFRQVRAERRWCASWGARGPRLELPEVYGEVVFVAQARFPASVAATALEALPLERPVAGRVARALGEPAATLAALPPRHDALLALSGVGPSTGTALLGALLAHLGQWRTGGKNGASRPAPVEAPGSAFVEARASIGDGLDELATLFATPT